MKNESLSKLLGFAKKEPLVSISLAAALRGPCGGELLAALLGHGDEELRVVDAWAEVTVLKSRFDVLAVYERGTDLVPVAIEVKVTAGEGNDQLSRYLEVLETDQFHDKLGELLQPYGISAEVVGQPELLYLTAAPASHVKGGSVLRKDFGVWLETWESSGYDCDSRNLETAFFLDVLGFLGGELGKERKFLGGLGLDTKLTEFKQFQGEGFILGKHVEDRVLEVLLGRLDKHNESSGADPFDSYWKHRGSGKKELGCYRNAWSNESKILKGEFGFLIDQIFYIDIGKLLEPKPVWDVRARLQLEPYETEAGAKAKLTDTQWDALVRLRDTYRDLLETAAMPTFPDYKKQNYYLQRGATPVAFQADWTLGQIADALWETMEHLAEAMSEALEQLRLYAGPFQARPHPDHDRHMAFKTLSVE